MTWEREKDELHKGFEHCLGVFLFYEGFEHCLGVFYEPNIRPATEHSQNDRDRRVTEVREKVCWATQSD